MQEYSWQNQDCLKERKHRLPKWVCITAVPGLLIRNSARAPFYLIAQMTHRTIDNSDRCRDALL